MEDCDGVLHWINSFLEDDLGCDVTPPMSLSDLWDCRAIGVVASNVLNDIWLSRLDNVNGNWLLAQNNLKKVIRALERFYKGALGKEHSLLSGLDTGQFCRDRDVKEIISLVEVLVGAAVQCPEKAQHVNRIMNLSVDSQSALQALIQSSLSKTLPLSSSETTSMQQPLPSYAVPAPTVSMDLILAREETEKLKAENESLQAKIAQAEATSANSVILETQPSDQEWQQHRRLVQVQEEADRLRTTIEEKDIELSESNSALEAAEMKLEAEVSLHSKLECELRRVADELDLAQDRSNRLEKAEAVVDKYKKRIEELSGLKDRLAESEKQTAAYLEQALVLEGENKIIPTLKKKIEQYKVDKIELERVVFQSQSSLSLKADELVRLRKELEKAVEARMFLEEQLISSKEQQSKQHSSGGNYAELGNDGSLNSREVIGIVEEEEHGGLFENTTNLKEQLVRLQKENEMLRSSTTVNESEQLEMVKSCLEDTERILKERSCDALAAKRESAELEQQCHILEHKLSKLYEKEADSTGHYEDRIAQLTIKVKAAEGLERTVSQLADQLKEKDGIIASQQSNLEKLESYAKKTLTKFAKQYVDKLQSASVMLKERQEYVNFLEAKLKLDRDESKREEQLLMSAVYELGMEIIERNLVNNMANGPSAKDGVIESDAMKRKQGQQQSWLQCQRELLESKTSASLSMT